MPNNRHILLNLNLHGRRYKTQIKKKVGSGHKRKGDSQTNTTSKSQSKKKKLFEHKTPNVKKKKKTDIKRLDLGSVNG